MTSIHPLFPVEIWTHFEQILKIPHGSHNCTAIVEFIEKFGNDRGLETIRDELGNVVIRKPAAEGRESAPMVCLQSHLDMVCEKGSSNPIDMATSPITPVVVEDGEFGPKLMAQDTTLGADDGIGVAAALAILDDKTLKHGAIECLFTIDEEVGMVGARALKPEFLKIGYLVNLDSEEDWKITVGCAGGFNVDETLEVEVEKDMANITGCQAISIALSEFKSGHSGVDIHLGRANPISCLGRVLRRVETDGVSVRLSELSGGTKRNVIAADARAVIVVGKDDVEKAVEAASDEFNKIKEEYETIEPSMKFESENVALPTDPSFVLTQESSHKVISIVFTAPHGVLRMSPITPDIVETSTNFFSVRIDRPSSSVVFGFFARSLSNTQMQMMMAQMSARCELLGLKSTPPQNFYYGWAPDVTSDLFQATKKAFVEAQGKEPEISSIHAGLECGILMGVYPHMKCVSIGPHITNPHTVRESLHLKTLKPFFETLKRLLEHI